MRVPVPKNRLVAFTLVGALLTGLIAVGLAVPGYGLTGHDDAAPAGANQIGNAPANPSYTTAAPGQHDDDHEREGGEEHEENEHDRLVGFDPS